MQRRIRWRIVLPYLILLLTVVAVFSVLCVNHFQEKEITRRRNELLKTAERIAAEAQPIFTQQDELSALPDFWATHSEILGATVTFLDTEGNILTSSLPVHQQPERGVDLPSVTGAFSTGAASLKTDNLLSAAVTVKGEDNQTLGFVHLQQPLSQDPTNLNHIIWQAIGTILVSGAAMIIVALIIQDSSIKPIETLTIAAQQMSMGNFENLAFPAAPPELHDLNQALQTMAEQLGNQINALTSERAKLTAVLNQMTDGVLIVDANGRVQLINPAAGRLFNIQQTTALNRSVVEVLRYHQLVELWRAAKNGKRQSSTLEIGPQHLFLQVVGIPLKTALPGSTLLIFQDLTQLRRLETVRRDFISNVSHELRTPLASLKALAETLLEGALDDPPAAQRFILRMETEIDNLTQLVNELLELSRIESGKVPLSFHRIKPCDLLQPAFDRMVLQAERAGLELILDCQPELPPVFADPDRITQVFINLIHNAIKFTPPGGRITLSAYQDNQQVVFFVRDTGMGIPTKDLSRIFERFYKIDRARTSGGTGLGLSIAKHMIESHSGYIWVESEQDVGSTFYFSLPLA